MIRLLFRLIVFALGLAAAGLWFGEMRHLRLALDDLPIWTELVEDRATLRSGAARIDDAGFPKLALEWRATMPSAEGLNWDLELSSDGVLAQAHLVVPWWPQNVSIESGKGTISFGAVSGAAGADLISIVDINGEIPAIGRASGEDGYVDLVFEAGSEDLSEQLPLFEQFKIAPNTYRVPIDLP